MLENQEVKAITGDEEEWWCPNPEGKVVDNWQLSKYQNKGDGLGYPPCYFRDGLSRQKDKT